MRQAIPASSPTIREELSHCLPGFKLTHTVQLVSSLDLGVVSRVANVLHGEQVIVERWAVTRCADVLAQKILFGEMTEGRAVRLRERLAAVDGVLRAKIEHHFICARPAAEEAR